MAEGQDQNTQSWDIEITRQELLASGLSAEEIEEQFRIAGALGNLGEGESPTRTLASFRVIFPQDLE